MFLAVGAGRTVNYVYDDLYRLTSETIANSANNGSIAYQYDPVGNRLQRSSTVSAVPNQASTYDANDRINSDTYDANGNTKASNGKTYNYDFENKLTSTSDGVTIVYDGDGNRVSKTVNGQTTFYLVDTNNLTGYAQVVEELRSGVGVVKQYTYGHDLISQRCSQLNAGCSLSFYSYDGHGSVRQLTDVTASVTDTYSYDAFGTLIERTGSTDNNYLYAGEQFDPDLSLYYNRARYLNVGTGRFVTKDRHTGPISTPSSLHGYTYCAGNGVNQLDPSGKVSVSEELEGDVLALEIEASISSADTEAGIAVEQAVVDTETTVTELEVDTAENVIELGESESEVTIEEAEVSEESSTVEWGESNSVELRANMKAAGKNSPPYPNAAHHIVAGNEPAALPAQQHLARLGISANEGVNGVFLRTTELGEGALHAGAHRLLYYEAVNEIILETTTREAAISALNSIADELVAGTFPW